ncbi:SMP-30/gluconolactonase/LRE family protein [Sphingorhabdus arenilitoris]|uniref:SMP-30/gluconolactonase/LRE family protein n=1 Tax=Sphingorhabdus arenilitoris TaxID=1490041 RepID=A0ABV8RJ28_9SPHN
MNMNRRTVITALGAMGSAMLNGCTDGKKTMAPPATDYPLFGKVEQFDPALSQIVDTRSKLAKLADGFWWSEGPVWDRVRQRLYFSDVPQNTVFSWNKRDGLQTWLKPSGLPDGADPAPFDSAGINGMWIMADGSLLAASHGKRAVTKIDIDRKAETILTGAYSGKKYNSPNDLVEAADGSIYFTDPPYGLKGQDSSPDKEQAHNGVYRLAKDGAVTLIDASLTRPNGVALSPDQKTLYVAQSDPDKQILKSYNIGANGSVSDNGLFFDAQPLAGADAPGLPDGMCVAQSGHIFATGPGGVLILSPQGKLLGRINPGKACANCCFGDDGRTLYLTASDTLASIPLNINAWG